MYSSQNLIFIVIYAITQTLYAYHNTMSITTLSMPIISWRVVFNRMLAKVVHVALLPAKGASTKDNSSAK